MELRKGNYYWVVYKNSEAFIAQYEGDYWMADTTTPIEEFNENHIVIKEVEIPAECTQFKII